MPTKEELNDLRKLQELCEMFREKWGAGNLLAFHVTGILTLGQRGEKFTQETETV